MTVGVDEQGPLHLHNQDRLLSQNVLSACSFDLNFCYILAGWEGSATDLPVSNSAITMRYRLQVPEGKYYPVENKHPNVPGFAVPYPRRGTFNHMEKPYGWIFKMCENDASFTMEESLPHQRWKYIQNRMVEPKNQYQGLSFKGSRNCTCFTVKGL